MRTRTYWERADPGGRRGYFVQIDAGGAVVVGEQSATPFADAAGSCSREEFLAGQFHDFVLAHFDRDVLAEIVEVVRAG